MANLETLLEQINRGCCLRDFERLADGEFVVSARSFPGLYAGKMDDRELGAIRRYLATIKLIAPAQLSAHQSKTIRGFLKLVFRASRLEEHVHMSFFMFWESIWHPDERSIALDERYIECETSNSETPFAANLVAPLKKDKVLIDIVGRGGDSMFLVEVKRGEVDDRAVGQVLRYYDHVRTMLNRRHHGCNIRQVVPVLIARSCTLAQWASFPRHFREFLRLYFIDESGDGVRVKDGKRILESQNRERPFSLVYC